MAQLSVNVNKIATLRNARGGSIPSVVMAARNIVDYGAHGITVHPRPDERHIKRSDVTDLTKLMNELKPKNSGLEFNIEGYPSIDFLEMIEFTMPDQCTLVPDPPDVITSNAGWKLPDQSEVLKPVIQKLRSIGVRSSVFVDPRDVSEPFLEELKSVSPDRVELYTEEFARCFGTSREPEVNETYASAGSKIEELGIELNAGHDLNQKNLKRLCELLPNLKEVSIGHALVCEALYDGLEHTVKAYLGLLK